METSQHGTARTIGRPLHYVYNDQHLLSKFYSVDLDNNARNSGLIFAICNQTTTKTSIHK